MCWSSTRPVASATSRASSTQPERPPGKLIYGSRVQGSSAHLDGELLADAAKIDIMHVPYKGGAHATSAMMRGEVQMLAVEISAALTLRDRLCLPAVIGEKRAAQLPGVPTTAELGYPSVEASSMYGVLAPTETPAAITEKFRRAVIRTLNQSEVKNKLLLLGEMPAPGTGDEYRQLMAGESTKWGQMLKSRNIRFD